MRTVSLSNNKVQELIREHFIALKVPIEQGTKEFPLQWQGVQDWRNVYSLMGGPRTKGFTACVVVDEQTKTQLGSTGSAMVWELFDSIAYDPEKFATMLTNAIERGTKLRSISQDTTLSALEKRIKTDAYKREIAGLIRKEGRFRFPPKGFTIDKATKLFKISGDL